MTKSGGKTSPDFYKFFQYDYCMKWKIMVVYTHIKILRRKANENYHKNGYCGR
jgi:hypothetical protein